MILNAEALDVLNYLKSSPGQFFSMQAISRRAGGRRRFEQSPGWAKGLMTPLVETGLVEINERGHYRIKTTEQKKPGTRPSTPAPRVSTPTRSRVVGDDFFPTPQSVGVVGDDYFPR